MSMRGRGAGESVALLIFWRLRGKKRCILLGSAELTCFDLTPQCRTRQG